jgi:hypothetical protein
MIFESIPDHWGFSVFALDPGMDSKIIFKIAVVYIYLIEGTANA